MHIIKNLSKAVMFVVVAVMLSFSAVAGGLVHSVSYKNRDLEYAYYVPRTLEAKTNIQAIILVPELYGKGENLLDQSWMDYADNTKRILIAPTFVFEGQEDFEKKRAFIILMRGLAAH